MKNINKRLIQQTKVLLKGQEADSLFIWKCMDEQEEPQATNVYYFCMKIFQTLINNKKKVDTSQNHEAMLSTLLVLEFYKNMKEKLDSFIINAKELFSQNHMKLYQHAEWVVELFLKNSEEASFAKQFISRVCHAPKKISWKVEPGRQFQDTIESAGIYCRQVQIQRQKQQKIYKTLKYTSFPKYFVQSKILAFGYVCFIDYLRSANLQVVRQIYDHMLDLLKGFVHASRITQKTNQLFINYMFLLKSLISLYGCWYQDILKQMAYLMTIVRNYPGIIGNYGSQLFETIHAELKCKGTTFRRKIRLDYSSIDLKHSDTLSKKIIILSNQPAIFNNPQTCILNNLRKLFIYNIFACCDPENASKNWKNLQLIDSQTTFKIYYKLSRLVDLTMTVQNYSQLQKLQHQSILQLIRHNPLTKGKVLKEQAQQLNDIVNHDHHLRYFSYPLPEITQVKLDNFENKKYLNSIYQLFQSCKIGNTELFYQNKVSLALIGDDYEVGRWLKTIVNFMQQLPASLIQKLQVYLIPIRKNSCSLAEFIAAKDLWYKRFVYNVFHQKVLFPDMAIQQNSKNIFPSYLYNKSFQMYIREAERVFPVQVYKCILKLSQIEQEEVIYFSSHLLIGTSSQIQILKSTTNQKGKKPTTQDGLEYYVEKIKKPTLININLQVSYKQSLSIQAFKRSQKNMMIEDLQICNTPREYFMGNVPNPSDRFLQMSILTQKMGKVFKKQLQNKDTFKRNNQHQIQQAFKDLFINVSADYILIQNLSQQPLKVVIDGAATNKVERIMILPAQNKEKYPIRIPIKTFLPFQI